MTGHQNHSAQWHLVTVDLQIEHENKDIVKILVKTQWIRVSYVTDQNQTKNGKDSRQKPLPGRCAITPNTRVIKGC
ncbi:hypothetical protein [Streptomyces phaeofaciens]|uniref:hypothetical protein n=1 Tax=Streptomyces phaeofaciens TaxID=68254 RepID=UPI00367D9A83